MLHVTKTVAINGIFALISYTYATRLKVRGFTEEIKGLEYSVISIY